MDDETGLPLPQVRCLTKKQAAAYLGIGVTLLLKIGPLPIKLAGARSAIQLTWTSLEKGNAVGNVIFTSRFPHVRGTAA